MLWNIDALYIPVIIIIIIIINVIDTHGNILLFLVYCISKWNYLQHPIPCPIYTIVLTLKPILDAVKQVIHWEMLASAIHSRYHWHNFHFL